jgi:cell division protease FtsH
MVMQLGMSTVSLSQLIPSEGAVNPYSQKLFSEQTALKADDEVEKIIKTSYEQAKAIISEHQDELHLIVKTLLTIETILRTDIEYIHTHKQLPEHVLKQINKVENFDNTAKEENSEVKAEGNTEVPVENKPATEEVKKTDKKPGRKPKSGNNDKKD